jgi:hypothetical protein
MPAEPVVPFGEATPAQFQELSAGDQLGQLQTGAGQNIQSVFTTVASAGRVSAGRVRGHLPAGVSKRDGSV